MTASDQEPVNAKALAAEIEPHAVASWPARETVLEDGWLLRFTNGFTHRGNSVATLQFSGADLDAAITTVQRQYRARGLVPQFQIATAVAPEDLAVTLLARGYRAITPTFVLATTAAEMLRHLPEPGHVSIADNPDRGFTALVVEGSRSPADGRERLDVLSRIGLPRACVTAFEGRQAVACGTATLSHDHVGINLMRTTPAHRRHGHARRVLAAIARWAEERDATRVYLGVEMANAGAVALYRNAGFVTAYSYRYFRKS